MVGKKTPMLGLRTSEELQRYVRDSPIQKRPVLAPPTPILKTTANTAQVDAVLLSLINDYAHQLDTTVDYIERQQVIREIANLTDITDEDELEDALNKLFIAMRTGKGTPKSRWYVGCRATLIDPHNPPPNHQGGIPCIYWLLLPSMSTRYAAVKRKAYIRGKTRVSDYEPYPAAPSADAWKRWEAEMTRYAVWYLTRGYLAHCPPMDEQEVAYYLADEFRNRMPNRGVGVTKQDVEVRVPAIVDNALKQAQALGYTVLTDPTGKRWLLPEMTPRKRF